MAISETLLNPEMTEGFAIFITGFLMILLYAGIRLYSTIVIASWAITVIIFIGTAMYDLSILLFYFGVISTTMLIGLASIRFSQIN